MNKSALITEIMSHLSPNGEEIGVPRFEVALALPNIVRQLAMDVSQGSLPVTAQHKGLSGNTPDISLLQELLQKTFVVAISASGEADLAPHLSSTEPIVLQYPFISVKHPATTSNLSMYVPDEETVYDLGGRFSDDSIVYTVIDRKIKFAPTTLTGSLTVTAFYLPTVDNLSEVFKSYIIAMALSMFGLSKGKK